MTQAQSSIHLENISYKHDGVEFEGILAYDSVARNRRPGILVCHAWKGRDNFARRKAIQLARAGYVAFALDMYGGGREAENVEEARKLSDALRSDRALLFARAQAGLKVLRSYRLVETMNLAVIGFCFGGMVALEMARQDADLRGAVSFHGLLDAVKTEAKPPGNIKMRILALHGYDDPLVPPKQLSKFLEEMKAVKADLQLISYAGTMHAFTNPDANDPDNGLLYNEAADRRSWNATQSFFEEIFD